MGFFDTESERSQAEHNTSQAEGSKAGLFEEFVNSTIGTVMTSSSQAKGFDNGLRHQPSPKSSSPSDSNSSGSYSSDSDWSYSASESSSSSRETSGGFGWLVILVASLAAAMFIALRSADSSSSPAPIKSAHSSERVSSSTAPTPKAAGASSNSSWQMPGSEESTQLEKADAEINQVYKWIMSFLTPVQQESLRQEQREWIKWRGIEADRVARSTSDGGSAYRVDRLNAMTRLVRQRTEYLRNYRRQTIPPPKTKSKSSSPPAQSKNRSKSDEDAFRDSVQRFNKF